MVIYHLTIDARGVISLPREALEALGIVSTGFVRLSSLGGNLVIERSPLQPVTTRDKAWL